MADKGQGFLKIENVRTVGSLGTQNVRTEAGSNLVYVVPQSVSGQTCFQIPAQSLQNVVQNQQGQSFIHLQVGQQLPNGQGVIQLPAGQNLSGQTTFIQVPSNQNSSELQQVIQVPINQTAIQMPSTATFTSAASDAGALPSTSQGKNVPVDYLLDNLIKNNEAILKSSDASAYKPRPREMSDNSSKTTLIPAIPTQSKIYKSEYPLMKHFLNTNCAYTSSSITSVPISTIKPTEDDLSKRKETVKSQSVTMKNVVARPRSPTRRCNLLKTDESLFMNTFVETRAKKKDSWPLNLRTKDIICGLSARAKVLLPGKGSLALDGNVYWCNFCPFNSESKPAFLSHVMIHRFSCKHCKFQAFTRAEVVRHSAAKHCHYDEVPWFFCSFFHDNLKLQCHNNKVAEKSLENLSDKDYEFMDMTIETTPKDEDDLDEEEEEDEDDYDEDVSMMGKSSKGHGEKSKKRNTNGVNLQGSAVPSSSPVQNANVLREEPLVIPTTSVVQKSTILKETLSDDWSKSSWICSYCDFVSQNYNLIKVHCSIMHPSESVSANQTKVTTEMAAQIKQLDSIRQLHLDKGQNEFLLSTDSNNSISSKPKLKPKVVMTSPVALPVKKAKVEHVKSKVVTLKRKASPVRKETAVEPTTSENKPATDVRSYECYNCHGQTIKIEELCSHLNKDHCGEPYVGIDLRAVRLKQARFIVFCVTPGCSFFTRFVQQYLEHYKTCFPDWNICEEIEHDTHKSIVSTMKFAMKNMQVKLRGKLKSKWFYCQGCQFKSNTIAHVKKHIIQFHKNRKPSYQYIHVSNRGKIKTTTYFCPKCKTFESQIYTTLQKHLKSFHKVTNLKLMYMYKQSEEDPEVLDEDVMEPDDDSSVSMDADSQDQGVKPNPEELQLMMDAYLEGETTAKMASLGTNSRHAAVKAHLKLQHTVIQPHLHRCRSCSYQCLGVNLMRAHLQTEHPDSDLIAQDMKKKSQHQSPNVYLCPQTGCRFSARVYGDVESHALSEHSVESGELKEQLKLPSDIKTEPLDIKTEPLDSMDDDGSYLCLYCKGSVMFSSTSEMRDHIKSNHPGEEIVMRDSMARKNNQPCRLYICAVETCTFSTPNQDHHIEHLQMHGDLTDINGESTFEDEEMTDDENMEINEEDLSLPPDIEINVN